MQFVSKGITPTELQNWASANQGTPNFRFEFLDGGVKEILRTKLLTEQSYICCYTGIRLTEKNNHIEHMIPQKDSRDRGKPEETVAYANMVVCDNSNEFGARYKADWPTANESHKFVKPTNPTCKTRFIYKSSGRVEAPNSDIAATTTIEKLNLNHEKLITLRKKAYRSIFAELNGKPVTKSFIRKRLKGLSETIDGKLEEFEFVLRQLLEKKLTSLP